MTEYSKLNIIYKLQKWMDSVAGQTFLNYAYSWGAAIVILGTLFKLTYLPYANIFLYLGMGTEVFVFFLSAFDRPFDKTADGMELKTHSDMAVNEPSSASATTVPSLSGVASSSPSGVASSSPSGSISSSESISVSGDINIPQWHAPQIPEGLDEQIAGYTAELENLNRTLTSISRVYEMQLKSASTQIGTIDSINEQTRHMATQIAELNRIYARMIEAMSVQNKMQ